MKIKYFSWIKNITGIDEEFITENNVKDIKSLKNYICSRYPKLKKYILKEDIIRVAINFEYTSKNKKLKTKDEIALFPPVSGG